MKRYRVGFSRLGDIARGGDECGVEAGVMLGELLARTLMLAQQVE